MPLLLEQPVAVARYSWPGGCFVKLGGGQGRDILWISDSADSAIEALRAHPNEPRMLRASLSCRY